LPASLNILLQKYPEIEQIITAWPELPEQDRKAVLEIIKR
jgi:hypothetical protein